MSSHGFPLTPVDVGVNRACFALARLVSLGRPLAAAKWALRMGGLAIMAGTLAKLADQSFGGAATVEGRLGDVMLAGALLAIGGTSMLAKPAKISWMASGPRPAGLGMLAWLVGLMYYLENSTPSAADLAMFAGWLLLLAAWSAVSGSLAPRRTRRTERASD